MVTAIIGILSSIVLVSMRGVREKARDSRRIQDLTQLQKAVELYSVEYGRYPQPANGWSVWSGHCPGYGNYDKYILGLEPWLSRLPKDPRFNEGGQCYLYYSNGTDYMILAHFTMETVGADPSEASNPEYIRIMDRVCCWQPTIAVYSPGGMNW